MNKDTLEEYLAESLAQLEMARDHAAGCESEEAFNRLNDICENVSDLLDNIEDNQLAITSKPRYTSQQAQLLYNALQAHSAASLQPGISSQTRIALDEALACLRMELLAFAAQRHAAVDDSHSEYIFDDSVDGQ
ncbi:hypothetical protein JCM14076_17420 [Methylosoma difficile]